MNLLDDDNNKLLLIYNTILDNLKNDMLFRNIYKLEDIISFISIFFIWFYIIISIPVLVCLC